MTVSLEQLRSDARAIYAAAVRSVEPGLALRRALALTPPPERAVVIAIGKAARPMAAAALDHLRALEVPLVGGVVVAAEPGDPVGHHIVETLGDHPVPGDQSAAAADLVATIARGVTPRDDVWVLVSGGASSLIGSPIGGIPDREYRALMTDLFRAGLPIGELNGLRKRFSRFGGGRLLAALAAERVRVFALSDVIGDQPGDIASGPCEPDPLTAANVRAALAANGVPLPPHADRWLASVEQGHAAETLKPTDPRCRRSTTRIVGSNQTALREAAAVASGLGYRVIEVAAPVVGPAAQAGHNLARELLSAGGLDRPIARIAGGETTVRLDPHSGHGGRCQELALAAAAVLGNSPARSAVLLAAGTDGRDGPTDAAGALVDTTTWAAIARHGLSPKAHLDGHDAYPALDAADALVRTGPTGTNVMDLMIGMTG